ncbi:PilZ domain-containing protein [Bacillus tuaregi]|uniref:PilZ domain-containing protein n=1 Tax=Bacillus tuaregi TaxID=1816695 RepID=UPI0008F8B9B5|nr:PilZ domain-containing protein [Bacillus tuaregi]
MLRYRRQEGFRFTFNKPIPVLFTIKEVDGNKVESSEGMATMMDISPNGLKLNTALNIPISKPNQIKVSVRFQLNDTLFQVNGMVIWREEKYNHFLYGVQFSIDDQEQEELINHLKSYVKSTADNTE